MTRQIKIDDFFHLDLVSDLTLHPNEKELIYVLNQINDDKEYVANLVHKDLESGVESQWTFGHDKNGAPVYSPCGKYVAFESNRTGNQQLYILPTEGGEAKQVTTFPYGVSNGQWGPNGVLYFNASLEEAFTGKERELTAEEKEAKEKKIRENPIVISRLKYKMEGVGLLPDRTQHIFAYDVETGKTTCLTEGETNHLLADVSHDGKELLYIRKTSDNEDVEETADVFLYDLEKTEAKQLTKQHLAIYSATFSHDGKQIAFLGHDLTYKSKTLTKIYIYNKEADTLHNISNDWDLPVGDYLIGDTRLGGASHGPFWDEKDESLYFIGTDRGTTKLYKTTLHGDLSVLYDQNCHIFDLAYGHEKIVFAMASPENPGNLYVLEKGHAQQITDLNRTFLDEVSLSVPTEEIFTAEDGTEIQGWLMKPPHFDPSKKYPFILEIHGGPHMMYGLGFFHEMQYLTAQGYVVLFTNPRGSHGYGQAFVDGVRHHYGEGDYTDLMTAVDQVLEKYNFIDQDRLGVTGGSYGGFMTNWIVGHTDRFKAAVTQRSISNWLSFYGVSDIGYFFNKWEHGIHLTEDVETLWDKSPLKYVEAVDTPLLILHGENDLRCPIEQAEQLYVALKHLDKDVTFVRFPGANHELSRSGQPKMRVHRLEQIRSYFDQYIG